MILNFYGKVSFVCLMSLSFFACEEVKNGPAEADRKLSKSAQKIPLLNIENQNNREQGTPTPLVKMAPSSNTDARPDSGNSVTTPGSSPTNKLVKNSGNGSVSSPLESQVVAAAAQRNGAVNNKGKGINSNSNGLSKNTERTARFPNEEFFYSSSGQMTELDALKGGSDLFHYYIQVIFNSVMSFVPQIKFFRLQDSWNQLCYKSDCLKGIDIAQMNQSKMRSAIKNFSLSQLVIIYDNTAADQSIENVFLLQGTLAPKGWDRELYIRRGKGHILPPHVKELKRQLKIAEQKGIRRIVVNLPFQFHRDPVPFFLLGDFIKRNAIDLHIVGGCGHYCATYLIPAAKTVYIEPYGYIYYTASFLGQFIEIQKIFNIMREKLKKQFEEEWLPGLTDAERVDFVVKATQPPITSPERLSNMIKFLKGDQVTFLVKEQKDELNKKFQKFQDHSGDISVTDWTDSKVRELVQGFSSELLEEIALFIKLETNDAIQKGLIYLEQLAVFSRLEREYYSKRIHVDNLDTKKSYNYMDLTLLFSRLLKDPEYENFFSEPKFFYNVPEKDKPYEWVVLSAELLRSVGLDIRGENNIEMIDFSEFPLILGENKDIKGKVIFMDSLAIERCGFLTSAVSYDTGRLKGCLADSIPKEAEVLFQRYPFSLTEEESGPIEKNVNTEQAFQGEAIVTTDSAVETDTDFLSNSAFSKDFNFPQKKYWNLKWEQVINFNFIKKGGSGLFYYYLQAWFNELNTIIEQMSLTANFKEKLLNFCYESDCSKGVDPEQIKEVTIPSVIKYLSNLFSIKVYPNKEEDINPDAQSIYFLQGWLASEGWNAWVEDDGNGNIPLHIQSILNTIYWMKQNKVQKIAVNLPPQLYEDPTPFFLLGKFIKENKVDLHIVGGCGHYCAAYLIPAARTVYMEPYGYIYHKGIYGMLFAETNRVMKAQRQAYVTQLERKWPNMSSTEKTDYVLDKIMQETSVMNMRNTVIQIIKFLDKNDAGKLKKFRDKLSDASFEAGKASFADFEKEDMKYFIETLSPELLKTVGLFLSQLPSGKLLENERYVRQLRYFYKKEKEYYSAIEVEGIKSQEGRRYIDLLIDSSILLRDPIYAEYFSVPKNIYKVPEKDKPYEWVVPSTELLKGFGIDIRGENNGRTMIGPEILLMLGKDLSNENILYLNSKVMDKCGLLENKPDPDNQTEKLKKCLARE